ncbi:unnamed protein product [Acanthosepion pharaonis]|uniref:Uncharacterized protein n=1 Tax=Acanthosepion pharaonis TaxID=158019 RepID=A0A812D6Y4_ACAPH|nr:unnamed protein product [Sepia pharaonis]
MELFPLIALVQLINDPKRIMGGFLSHSIDVESAYPSPEACKNTCHFHDPRSPSLDINRTPIMVADPVHTILDPRSPSEGIERTPITYQLPQKYRKSCTTDDASQTLDKIPPLCFEDDMDISKTEENDQLSPSFIAEIDSGDENKNDSNLESVKISLNFSLSLFLFSLSLSLFYLSLSLSLFLSLISLSLFLLFLSLSFMELLSMKQISFSLSLSLSKVFSLSLTQFSSLSLRL